MNSSYVTYKAYDMYIGIEPKEEDFNKTLCVTNYLKDNGYTSKEILYIYKDLFKTYKEDDIEANITYESINKKRKNYIDFEDIPEYLWDGSLTEKNKFYYSEILHIKSKAPTWNPITFEEECEPFYLEMKMRFTLTDLLDYFYSKCRVDLPFRDDKKTLGALSYLLNKYDRLNIASGLDIVIALINAAGEDTNREMITDIFEINDYLPIVIEEYKKIVQEAEVMKANKIVWRSI